MTAIPYGTPAKALARLAGKRRALTKIPQIVASELTETTLKTAKTEGFTYQIEFPPEVIEGSNSLILPAAAAGDAKNMAENPAYP
jgi:hypothetical protein